MSEEKPTYGKPSEKTFKELIFSIMKEEKEGDFGFSAFDIEDLLKQVREATIAECKDLIWDEYGLYRKAHEIEAEFDNLPTDRIKTEK